MDRAEKTREDRLRRVAERQGLRLVKSRRRDPRAIDYGTYALADDDGNWVMLASWWSSTHGHSLDDIELALDARDRRMEDPAAYAKALEEARHEVLRRWQSPATEDGED